MDKKQLLSNSLAKIMFGHLSEIRALVEHFPQAHMTLKPDGTPVTELDLKLSELVEGIVDNSYPQHIFYSEEKYKVWDFPMAVLDPLDGTREYIEGRNEWAISLALFNTTHFEGEGWIYNPLKNECFTEAGPIPFAPKEAYRGEVSRSEWKKGLFTNRSTSKFALSPVGSIAYKLARLSNAQSDFVVSLRPKNIWDIAAGTVLCQQAGFKFYSQGKEVTSVMPIYEPPLIWCPEELYPELSRLFP